MSFTPVFVDQLELFLASCFFTCCVLPEIGELNSSKRFIE